MSHVVRRRGKTGVFLKDLGQAAGMYWVLIQVPLFFISGSFRFLAFPISLLVSIRCHQGPVPGARLVPDEQSVAAMQAPSIGACKAQLSRLRTAPTVRTGCCKERNYNTKRRRHTQSCFGHPHAQAVDASARRSASGGASASAASSTTSTALLTSLADSCWAP